MLNKLVRIIALIIFLPLLSFTQERDYNYLFPINPNQQNYLSGSMGELRSSHFHAGLDIRTGGQEGWPVYASMDGYVSRVKISTVGYGNCIYMLHPNGHTTVYAHLSELHPTIAAAIKKTQYAQKKFEVEIFPDKNEFSFKKGEQIGWSGNSGSSGGPHLHFEIRDPYQRVLNPLRYGFDEIVDNIAPVAKTLALKAMTIDSRVNHQYGRFKFELNKQNGNSYIYPKPIFVHGKIGIELYAFDMLNGAPNRNGISSIKVYKDDTLVFHQLIDTLSFSLQRHINVHYDFAERKQTGTRFHRLYKANGNELLFYQQEINKGIIQIESEQDAIMRLELVDSYGNTSQVQFTLIGQTAKYEVDDNMNKSIDGILTETDDLHQLMIYVQDSCSNESAVIQINGKEKTINPAYRLQNSKLYVWHLGDGIPSSFKRCELSSSFNYLSVVYPKKEMLVYHPNMEIEFSRNALFDTLYFEASYSKDESQNWEIFSIGNPYIPLKSYIDLKIKPKQVYPDKEKTAVYAIDEEGNFNFVGGNWVNDQYHFSTNEMGNFTLLTDSIPPTIMVDKLKPESFSFYIKDDMSGIKSYELNVNGEWILMRHEPKKNLIWSDFPDDIKQISGEMELKVTDQVGNESIFKSKI